MNINLQQERGTGQRMRGHRIMIAGGVVVVLCLALALSGIFSAGDSPEAGQVKVIDPATDRRRAEAFSDEMRAATKRPTPAPVMAEPPPLVLTQASTASTSAASKPAPTHWQQWEEEKLFRAYDGPQVVASFNAHGAGIAQTGEQSTRNAQVIGSTPVTGTTLRPPVPFAVLAGSFIPATLGGGINSDMPGQVLATVSHDVYSADHRSVLIPQFSTLLGQSMGGDPFGERVSVVWKLLRLPNGWSMPLPQLPAADPQGFAGLTDQVDNHYLQKFGTGLVLSLISAGQQTAQVATMGNPYGSYGEQPDRWAQTSQTAGSGASAQMGAIGQQSVRQGMSRPPTVVVREGAQFIVIVNQDLPFPGPYGTY